MFETIAETTVETTVEIETPPTVDSIRRHNGVAGQFSISCAVSYPGEMTRSVYFVGSTYGGPVVAIWNGAQMFVTDPERFGDFGTDPIGWVRRYFA